MSDIQHKEWFIAVLLPHTRVRLEVSPIKETGTEMVQIQLQLSNLLLQIQDINKGKEILEEVWCTRCKT